MLTLLSPAKTLDFESPLRIRRHTVPVTVDDAAQLIEVLARRSPGEVGALMGLSPALADVNVKRFHDWDVEHSPQRCRPAIHAFKGDVYLGLDVDRFDSRDLTEAQKAIRILSGLYGVLRPLDLIHPYRLEMGTRLATDRGTNLYEFWGDRITEVLNAELAGRRNRTVVNLASQEYFGAVRKDRLCAEVVAPTFLDEKHGSYKVISFYAKRARGAMAAWLVQQRVRRADELREFDGLGYRYDESRSTPERPVFTRAVA